MAKKLPQPLFDSLQHMLDENDYLPTLEPQWHTDFHHAKAFLLSYKGSQDTFNAYRREIERFLQWCQLRAKKTLIEIQREDFENYLAFCQKPLKSWISLAVERRYTTVNGKKQANPKWRPFVIKQSKANHKSGGTLDKANYQLSEKSFKAIFAIIGSFYNFLIQEEYTQVNPVIMIRQKNKYFKKRKINTNRRLSEQQWACVIDTAEIMANELPEKHERTLFIMNALYGMYLRISELAANSNWTPTMSDLQRDHEGRWWFSTIGKGNKERKISISTDMLNAFKRYRKSLGLPPLPSPSEKTPLLTSHKGNQSIRSSRYIRTLVQQCFDRATDRLINDGQKENADQLMAATVHWLRHTGISDDVKIRPREHVRDDAGHSSSNITDQYVDIELDERHKSAKKKRIKPILSEN